MREDGKWESQKDRKSGKSESPKVGHVFRTFRLLSFRFFILYCGFLLAEAMETTKPPDDLCRINANNFPVGKAILDDL
jgi:hypothetical protein